VVSVCVELYRSVQLTPVSRRFWRTESQCTGFGFLPTGAVPTTLRLCVRRKHKHSATKKASKIETVEKRQ